MGEARVRAATGRRRAAVAALLALTTTATATGVLPAAPAAAQVAPPRFVVTTASDGADADPGDGACDTGSGACTLRAAVAEANALGGATVELPSGTYRLDGGRGADTGDLDVTAPVSIAGEGATTVVQGVGDRVLDVQSAGVTVTGVVVTGGTARDGAGVNVTAAGGLTLVDSTVTGNVATNEGGGIANAGRLVVRGSTISGNAADRRGGGIHNGGTATIENATIHANRSNAGGGVISTGTAGLLHVTISANESTNRLGGGLQRQGGVVDVRASIIAENLSNSGEAKDCSGSPTLQGLNLIGNVSGCNPTGTAPLTGASGLAGGLADNGGPTPTQALLPTSQALDRLGEPCPAAVDQRGVPRPSGPACDLGAYELQALGVGLTLDAAVPVGGLGAGAATVPLAALREAATGPVVPDGTTGTALRSIALRSIALRSITVESVALRSIALRSIALRSIALRSIALRSIFAASTALRSIALRSILLSDVEVAGGWEELLDGTPFQDVPLQNLTLEDVAGLSQVQALTLEDVDLSATRIGSLSIVGLLLGTTALRSIPLEGVPAGATDVERAAAWCGLLGVSPCPVTADNVDEISLLSLDLAGTALRSIALRSILLADLDLSASALRSIPLGELAPGGLPDVVDCTKVDCASPTTTLGDADLAGALRGTMADLLLALLGDQDLAWEDLDLDGGDVQAVAAPTEPTVSYEAGIDLQGGAPADVTLAITLPAGFAYQRGSARLDGATTADPAVAGSVLTFTLAALAPGDHELTIAAWAGLLLGDATTTAQATATSSSGTATSPLASADVSVGEAFEEPVPVDDQRPIGDDRLHIAHLSFPGDVDLYAFDVTAEDAARGSTASIRLANLPADYDLALYGPPLDPLRNPPTERRDLLPDHQLDLAAGDDNLTSEPTADVPQVLPFDTIPVIHRISARRSQAAEQIDTGSLRAGRYWVQVSGANGASSDLPYSLQLRLDTGVDRGVCAAPAFTNTMPAPGALPDTSAGTLDAVFLVNTRRLTAAYGADRAATVLARLAALADRPDLGIRGAVVPVDGDPDVDAAYAAWDADRCSADAANQVVGAIGDLVDDIRAANPDLADVVLVGDDLQVPFARVPDATRLSNEQSFADTFEGNNELVAAFAGGFVLSDNPYGTSAGIAVNDHELFVPELAVGRLVETPEEIADAVDRFTAAGGVLDPASALVTGYDFLADGADAVAAALGGATELISEYWDRADLAGALAALDAPAVASVNAHFDHTRLLPGLGNSTGDETDLFTSADVTGAVEAALTDALLFSMGCHSGLAVSDITVGATPDWAQTFGDVAGGWVANTGFGYGDTDLVALSEDLMARFAARLVQGDSAGIALAAAKQEYAAAVALVSPYDEKVVHEATLYGLPMLRLAGAAPADATAATAALDVEPPLVRDPHTGLQAAEHDLTFTISSDGTQVGPDVLTPAGSDDGNWFHVDGDTLDPAHRPVQPRTTVDVARAGDGAPRPTGVLLTELTSVDFPGFDPLFFSPTVDDSEHEPRSVAADATFPARFVDVTSTNGPGGADERLVVVPGQFRRTAVPGTGTQRLFTQVGTLVYYGDGATAGGPPIGVRHTTAAASGGVARFQVDLDRAAERVYVLYKQQGVDATWTGIDLAPGPGNSWLGEGPGDDPLEYIVQAVSPDGQVYWATSKGDDFGSVPGGDTGEITIDVTGPTPTAGWYPGAVTVAITGGAGLQFSLDGGAYVPYTTPFAIGGDGLHSVVARDDSGALEIAFVAVDTAAPTVTVTGSNGWVGPSGTTVTLTASDGAGSGVASISYRIGDGPTTTVPGDTAEVPVSSSATLTFSATDVAGNTGADQTHAVRVDADPPVVDCGAVDTQWHDANVTRACTARDGQSGLADPADAGFTLSTNVADGSASATAPTGTRQVCDAVGNCVTAGPLTFMVDRADPTITITSPVDGAGVTVGDTLVADYACADVGSGVAAADCTARIGTTSYADGAALPTGTAGTFAFTVTAVDGAGNTTTRTATYTVADARYRICLLYNPSQASRIGSAYPIKIQLCDASGNNLSSPSIEVRAHSIDGGEPLDEGNSNADFLFRYDAGLRGYIYNLDTSGLAPARHELQLRVDGVLASSYVAPFRVR